MDYSQIVNALRGAPLFDLFRPIIQGEIAPARRELNPAAAVPNAAEAD